MRRLATSLHDDRRFALFFFLSTLVIYAASTAPIGLLGHAEQSDQLHYSYLAEAFLNGRLNITLGRHEADALSEIVVYGNRCYVLFPPLPAILLMPLILVFGKTFPTILLSIFLAAVSVGLMYTLLRRLGFTQWVSAWVTALFGFGTTFWYTSVNGSVWWLGQIAGVFFLLIALVESYGKRRPFLIGTMIGAATLSRLPIVLSTPFFLLVLLRESKRRVRTASLLLLGVGLFVGLNFLYNWIRFGTSANVAYYMIPEVSLAPWYKQGVFDLSYIPRNIYAMFFQSPVLVHEFPYIVPSSWGLSLFFTTPALLLAFAAPGDWSTWVFVGGAFLVSLPSLLHGFPGAAQFGYRYSLDYTPFLMVLTAKGISGKLVKKAYLLIVLSCAVSLWGLRYTKWIEPQWIFDVRAYYKYVHPQEPKINSVCVVEDNWQPLISKLPQPLVEMLRHLRERF